MGQIAVTNFPTDPSSGAVEVIEYEHHQVHEGVAFHASEVVGVDTTTQKWLITTPNSAKEAHMIFAVEATGEVLLTVTEGADRTGTTPLTAINHNRNSATVATTTVHQGATGGTTDGAVTIFPIRAGATGQASKTIATGAGRSVNEYVLKQNTKYVVSAQTFGTIFVSLILDWYEHTAKA